MSGITPLLDTLLHQVLGRRVDIPLPRDLNQPVGAPVPAQASRAVEDDSRLEPHESPSLHGGRAEGARYAAESDRQPPGALRAQQSPPQSATLSLSPAARVIAEVLERFPQSPGGIAPSRPLLEVVPQQQSQVEQVAARLQSSIKQSGLFFESHVEQWFRGELPFASLLREPQMHGVLASASSAETAFPVVGDAVPAEEGAVVAAGPSVAAIAAKGDGERAKGVDEVLSLQQVGLASSSGDSQAADLRGALVRHQLELLAVPQLRWEGSAWPGVFMTLVIDAPRELSRQDVEPEGCGEDEQSLAGEWRISFGLRLAGQGELEAAIRLRGSRLAVTLQSEQAGLRDYFETSRPALQARLQDCGFSPVFLRLADSSAVEGVNG